MRIRHARKRTSSGKPLRRLCDDTSSPVTSTEEPRKSDGTTKRKNPFSCPSNRRSLTESDTALASRILQSKKARPEPSGMVSQITSLDDITGLGSSQLVDLDTQTQVRIWGGVLKNT